MLFAPGGAFKIASVSNNSTKTSSIRAAWSMLPVVVWSTSRTTSPSVITSVLFCHAEDSIVGIKHSGASVEFKVMVIKSSTTSKAAILSAPGRAFKMANVSNCSCFSASKISSIVRYSIAGTQSINSSCSLLTLSPASIATSSSFASSTQISSPELAMTTALVRRISSSRRASNISCIFC